MPLGATGLVGRCVQLEGGWKPFCEVEWQAVNGWASSCCMADLEQSASPSRQAQEQVVAGAATAEPIVLECDLPGAGTPGVPIGYGAAWHGLFLIDKTWEVDAYQFVKDWDGETLKISPTGSFRQPHSWPAWPASQHLFRHKAAHAARCPLPSQRPWRSSKLRTRYGHGTRRVAEMQRIQRQDSVGREIRDLIQRENGHRAVGERAGRIFLRTPTQASERAHGTASFMTTCCGQNPWTKLGRNRTKPQSAYLDKTRDKTPL